MPTFDNDQEKERVCFIVLKFLMRVVTKDDFGVPANFSTAFVENYEAFVDLSALAAATYGFKFACVCVRSCVRHTI